MIVKYYQGNVSLDKMTDLCRTTKKGTSAYHLINAAESLGFHAKGMHCSFSSLLDDVLYPFIAHVTIDNTYNHYVVVYENNRKQNNFLIADPADKIKKISYQKFKEIYNETILLFTPTTHIVYDGKEVSIFSFFKNLCFKYKSLLRYFIVISLLFTILSILSALYMKYMIELSQNAASFQNIQFIFLFFLCIMILQSLTFYLRNSLASHINQKISFVLTSETFSYLLSLPYPYFRNRTTGEILLRMQDVGTLQTFVSTFMGTIFIDFPLSIIALFFLFHLQVSMFVYISVLCIFYLLLYKITASFLPAMIEKFQRKRETVHSFMTESIAGFETIKALHIKKTIMQVFEHYYLHYFQTEESLHKQINILYLTKYILDKIGYIFLIYMGVILIRKGNLTIPTFLTCTTLYSYILLPFQNFVQEVPQYKKAIISLKRIGELYISKPKQGYIHSKIRGHIIFSNLTYTYNEQNDILKMVSMEIRQQSKVMILGKSGVGKSTLLKILMKYYDTNRGMVYIDGLDLCDYDKSVIERDICYISQNEVLFTDSLYNNLTLWKKVDPHHLQKILKICEIEEIMDSHSQGLYMPIEENGFNLSGGERQRIILARALLCDFEVLLIDEGMSEIDGARESRILKGIFSYCLCKTILFVTHRTRNASLFDQIIRLEENGQILNIRRKENGKYMVQK